jgi:hypothetical protein
LILAYKMQRVSGLTVGLEGVYRLCLRHLEIRKAVGWVVLLERASMSPRPDCDDCEAAKQPTVMDRVIEAEEAAAKSDEPAPVRVLPGQRRLF